MVMVEMVVMKWRMIVTLGWVDSYDCYGEL